jgi:2-polyprenyl-6-methoxyphenol hydroxylase-like FAD-dependent oxidoreductase
LLLVEAEKNPLIKVVYSHRLIRVQSEGKELHFDCKQIDGSNKKEVVIRLKDDERLIGADGVNSLVRSAMDSQVPGFSSKVTPWKCEFRVLFASLGNKYC